MLQSIWDDVRREFNFGNMINKIIIVNVAVFLAVSVLFVIFQIANGWPSNPPTFYKNILDFFSVSHDWWHMLTHPWALITHMFLHEGFFHLLFNMLFLFWFGRIFGDLLGDKRVLPLYIAGGLAGFVAYFLAFNVSSLGTGMSYAYGASGSVACILTAAGIFAPEYGIRLIILGDVRLKWIVFAIIVIQFIGLGSTGNIGGTIDHIGGIIFGFLYVFYLRRGTDVTRPIVKSIDWIQNTWHGIQHPSKEHDQSGPRAAYRGGRPVQDKTTTKTRPSFMRKAGGRGKQEKKKDNKPQATHQEQLDAILDKIKEEGYNSLTKDEKDFLFRASNE
jgi:membrane associated rhomboid family serine protease